MNLLRSKTIDEWHLNRYPLSVGEIVKFGRVSYKISKIHNNNNKEPIVVNKQASLHAALDVTETEGD